MRLVTIDSVATTQKLRTNLQSLGMYAETVSGVIDKVHNEFNKNYSQLIARGATIHDPISILFEAYLVVPCHHLKSYICCQHEDYLDDKLTTITHKALMMLAKCKFDWLKTKGLWGAKSPDNKKIVAMTATLNVLKGQLKLDPKMKERKRVTTRTRRRRKRRILTTVESR